MTRSQKLSITKSHAPRGNTQTTKHFAHDTKAGRHELVQSYQHTFEHYECCKATSSICISCAQLARWDSALEVNSVHLTDAGNCASIAM